ncbi:hypothetical protein [Streptomyces sp. OM5714]|uniref:hypothetical protein n=1 Tax=Streptomyces sp. OM5714 TaxID=2602736 RepID=UPI0013DC349A|nr:hypothetical protein [Streptomyces sp. OM5714]KAF2774637.1 hypothetical protein STPH1_7682 [Streptomyces sp. OM5714]
MDFETAIASVTADLTPQPWAYTATDGAHLTVIPAGLREDPDCAEVLVRITDSGQTIEAGIPTAYLPGLIDALTGYRLWSHDTLDDVTVHLAPFGGGGMILALTDDPEAETAGPQVHVPEAQRLPLASALRRALDVARGWES